MKNTLKSLCLFCIISLPVFAFSQSNYQAPLKKLNDYLKTFDNGYYGYFEVKDAYLWGRFPTGKYTKTPVDQLGDVTVAETNRKVTITCKNSQKCVFSTYTDSYHSELSFSQSKDFNTGELITLINNLKNALQSNNTVSSTANQSAANAARLEREKEVTKPAPVVTQPNGQTLDRSKYIKALNALNAYLKTFNPETYGDVSIKGDEVNFEFKVYTMRYVSSIPISVLTQNTIITKGSTLGDEEVKIQCKGESDCFYSSYNKSNTDHFRFFSNTEDDLTTMKQLVEDFVNALK